MGVWMAAVLGLTGGLCVEALELYAHIRRTPAWNWHRPIDQGMPAFTVAVLLRVAVGALVAAALTAGHQVSGPLAALALGAAASVAVARLARAVPLTTEPGQRTSRRPSGGHRSRGLATTRPLNVLQAGDVHRRVGPLARSESDGS
jgi:hypothetical protein